jgi:hypothetical protein
MSMIGNLRTVDDSVIDSVLAAPDTVHEVVHPDEEMAGAEHLDIDKAWHTIHYILAGNTWGGDFPWGFLISCGTPIGEEDVGYGPARAFRSVEVKQLATAISTIDDATFRQKFSVDRMKEADVYPSFGRASDEEEIPYFLDYFQKLRSFVQRAAERKKGLIVYVD